MNQAFLEHFRCPEDFGCFEFLGAPSQDAGFFSFGPDAICYGHVGIGFTADDVRIELHDVSGDVQFENGRCLIPFNPTAVVENLRRERYVTQESPSTLKPSARGFVRKAYYLVRPLLPVAVRRHLQRMSLRGWERIAFPSWPVDRSVDRVFEKLMLLALETRGVDRIPFIWFWPEGKSGSIVMTHDVETRAGLEFCPSLMDLNDSFGIKSSFQLIPEGRYHTPSAILDEIRNRGFEVCIHDWNHDGQLYSNRETYLARAQKINEAAVRLGAKGFRSGVLYRNIDWYDSLGFSYDMSVPSVGHLDPQPGGCCTVMPYFIGRILEIPLTTTQDYPLLHILRDYSIDLWKQQARLIIEGNGLISTIVHPDYVIEKRARAIYAELLGYLSNLALKQNLWIALPREIDRWWRERSQMKLMRRDSGWEIEGPGKERARIAFAIRESGRLRFVLDESGPTQPSAIQTSTADAERTH